MTLPSLEKQGATTTATTTPVVPAPKKVAETPAKVAKPAAPKPATPVAVQASAPVAPPAPLVSSGNASLDVTATALRAALVNIVCYAPASSVVHSISGSGIFIDAKGIILTNAHIAQYFLLADRGVSCTIRGGNPAVDEYKAALIYISPLWLRVNATVLTQSAPIGTGEYDFALLAITKSATGSAAPDTFPYVPLAHLPPPSGTPVVIATYGAQFLETSQIRSSLYPTVVFGSVKDIFTFNLNTVDVLALGGSAAAQEGSSGGGVANAAGELIGTVTTSTVQGDTASRSLDAITASYIRAEYAREMNLSLDVLLSQPIAQSVSEFSTQMPALETIITAQLP
jgi:S1-C subfamily serine protease